MIFRTAHLVLVGFVILFDTIQFKAYALNGDILTRVLTEIEDLTFKVNRCEDKLTNMDDVVYKMVYKLRTVSYEQRLTDMEERLLAAERKLKITDELYKKSIAQSEGKFHALENKLKAFEELKARVANEKKVNVDLNYKMEESDFTVYAAHFERKHRENNPTGKKQSETKGSSVPDSVNEGEIAELSKIYTDDLDGGKTERVEKNNIKDTRGLANRKLESASDIKYEKRLLNRAVSHRIAFTAYVSVRPSELGRQHTIPFDKVLLNEGKAYDNYTNFFICPVNGIYIFQSALMCDFNDIIQTEIVKDGTPIGRLYAKGSNGHDQGFNSATIQCNKGEHVWVRIQEHTGRTIFNSLFSTFSGHILWET